MATPSRLEEDLRKPSKEYDDDWIHVRRGRSAEDPGGVTLGKWLVFKGIKAIDKAWETVRSAIISGKLGSCRHAKVSTMKESELSFDPNIKVICVYTTAEDMDDIGMKLIPLVRQTIRYKTDEATLSGVYRVFGASKTTCRTLEWNDGSPKFKEPHMAAQSRTLPSQVTRPGPDDPSAPLPINDPRLPSQVTDPDPEDPCADSKFIRLRCVDGRSEGKWLIFAEAYNKDGSTKECDLDATWIKIRDAMRSGNLPGAIHAKVSTLYDVKTSPLAEAIGNRQRGVIVVYTKERDLERLGWSIVDLVERTIKYKRNDERRRTAEGAGQVCDTAIYWNGEDYSPKLVRHRPFSYETGYY